MTPRSTISLSRDKYIRFGSSACGSGPFAPEPLPPDASKATISSSIFFVASGSAGAPSGVENLMPLYSGGLCEAVKLIAPSALACVTAYEMAGVGAASAITSGVIPWADRISAAIAHRVSPMKPRVSSHDDLGALRLLRNHVARNPIHCPPHVGKRELIRHHRAPTRSPELDLCCHGSNPAESMVLLPRVILVAILWTRNRPCCDASTACL